MKKLQLKHVLVLPVIVMLASVSLFPFVVQIYLSFTDAHSRNYFSAPFIGLDNYKYALIDPAWFWESLRVSVTYVALAVTLEFLLGLSLALLIYPLRRAVRIIVSLAMFPMLIAPVFIGTFGRLLFHSLVGVVPYYLRLLSLPVIDLSDPVHAMGVVVAFDVYQWTPFMFLIIHAGLTAMSREPIEAAKIDGASSFALFRHVMWPMLKFVSAVAIVIRTMDAFKAFEYPFVLYCGAEGGGGGPGGPVGATTTLSIIIYKAAFGYDNYGIAAAITILVLVVVSVVVSQMVKYFFRR